MSIGKYTQAGYLMAIVVITFMATYLFFDIIHHIPPIIDESQYGQLKYRLVYIRTDLDNQDNLQFVLNIMKRAKDAGYNGIVLSDCQFEKLDQVDRAYLDNVRNIKETAKELRLAIYPTVLTVGGASSILSHDPNFVEGLPVQDALFIAHNGQADLVPDPIVSLPGGDFEQSTGNTFLGWDSQDFIGTKTFVDKNVKHTGSQSLRIEATGKYGDTARVRITIDVSPYRQYHLSFWMKTNEMNDTGAAQPYVQGVNDGRYLIYQKIGIASTHDWKQYDFVFNSLDNTQVYIVLGTWNASGGGTIWIDDAMLEEIGLTNVIRRSAYPIVVKGEDGTVYTEGTDFLQVKDPLLGVAPSPGNYDIYHTSPVIQLTDNSRIKEGQKLRVSFYSSISYYSGQVASSLTDPTAQRLYKDQVVRVNNLLNPPGFLVNYDEIRVGNWETRPAPMTQGEVLAYSIKSNTNMIHSISPDATVLVWSDMFDPYENAIDNYFLCNGTCDGAYLGLSTSTIIVNWNFEANRNDTLDFFSRRGNPQILAGYYDGKGYPINGWLKDANSRNANIVGVMYTTWVNDYSNLETFANEVWGSDRYGNVSVTPTL